MSDVNFENCRLCNKVKDAPMPYPVTIGRVLVALSVAIAAWACLYTSVWLLSDSLENLSNRRWGVLLFLGAAALAVFATVLIGPIVERDRLGVLLVAFREPTGDHLHLWSDHEYGVWMISASIRYQVGGWSNQFVLSTAGGTKLKWIPQRVWGFDKILLADSQGSVICVSRGLGLGGRDRHFVSEALDLISDYPNTVAVFGKVRELEQRRNTIGSLLHILLHTIHQNRDMGRSKHAKNIRETITGFMDEVMTEEEIKGARGEIYRTEQDLG